jgi:hypothetical protein
VLPAKSWTSLLPVIRRLLLSVPCRFLSYSAHERKAATHSPRRSVWDAKKSRFGQCKRAALPARVNRLPESVVASLQWHSHSCLCPRCSTLNKPTQGKRVLHINSRPHKVKTRIYEAGACQLPIRADGRECLS